MIQVEFMNNFPYETEPNMVKGPWDSLQITLEYLRDPEGDTIAVWNQDKLRWSVYTKGIVHYFTDYVISEWLCTSDDPTNHQGDTCPIHEKGN